MENRSIVGAVRAEVARARITQTHLATQLGISRTTLHRKLQGQAPWHAGELASLAQILQVPVSALIPASKQGAA